MEFKCIIKKANLAFFINFGNNLESFKKKQKINAKPVKFTEKKNDFCSKTGSTLS